MAPRRTKRKKPERRFIVHGVRRQPTDVRKLGKALLSLVLSEHQFDTGHRRNEGGPGDGHAKG